MAFNTLDFLIFFALFMAAYPLARRRANVRYLYLTVASFVFYGWWDWRFLFLLAGSGLNDFFAARAIVRFPRYRALWLAASILGNLGSLATFKYLDFAISNVNPVLSWLGVSYQIPLAHLILPVGISFYTFQSLSYTIDVYKGKLEPTRNILHFFAFISLFPQLVAGPIVRAYDLLPQLTRVRPTTEADRWAGLLLVAQGYFKKLVIADNLAPFVNQAFGAAAPESSCAYWWAIMLFFSLQIYGDFSGYSDIARGLARWMGYDFLVNFDHPYIASSARDFWSRWHISLSTWFRDYVYIPLGGSRKGTAHSYVNMWVSMLVSGVWHGASWQFVVWGALHAMYLSVERMTKWPERLCRVPGGRHLAVLLVFGLVLIAWVFFRARTFGQAAAVLTQMFSFNHWNPAPVRELIPWQYWVLVGVVLARQAWFHLRLDQGVWVPRRIGVPLRITATAALLWASVYLRGPGGAFIYFQF